MTSIFDRFAEQFSQAQGEDGDAVHQVQLDPYIYGAIGDPEGRVIYDIGCGNGYMSRRFARLGAKVYASDESEKLLKIARDKSTGLDITYNLHDATDFKLYKKDFFDAVVMNMVIHFIKDLDELIAGIARSLKPGGILVFSTNHFLRPVAPYSEWAPGKIEDEERLFTKVTGYLKREQRALLSWWDLKTKIPVYNRPLEDYVNTMSRNNIFVHKVNEPESEGVATRYPKKLQESHHIPSYLIVAAKKLSGI